MFGCNLCVFFFCLTLGDTSGRDRGGGGEALQLAFRTHISVCLVSPRLFSSSIIFSWASLLFPSSLISVDGSGHIDADELSRMIVDIIPAGTLEGGDALQCAKAVVKHLDKDGNGMLEEEEFFSWVGNGMKMSPSDRKQLVQGGGSKATLVRFLEAVERVIG